MDYVSSDKSLEFQLDRMSKLDLELGVSPESAKKLKEKYGIWSGMESKDFEEVQPRVARGFLPL